MLSRINTISVLLLAFPFAGQAQEQPRPRTAFSRESRSSMARRASSPSRGTGSAPWALTQLQVKRCSFSLGVTHRTPLQVQWSCIADGIQTATGVSAGNLNLHLMEKRSDKFETVIQDNRSGKMLIFRLQPEFLTKYLDTPEDRQAAAARDVLTQPDSAIFAIRELKVTP